MGGIKYRTTKEMKDSEVEWFNILPLNWELKKLKFLVVLKSEKGTVDSNSRFIGLENIESKTGRYITPSDEDEVVIEGESIKFNKNDILFGKLRPYLAKCVIAEFGGYCSSEILVLNPKRIKGNLLKYLILNDDFINKVNSSTYGVKMPRASWGNTGNITFPLPTQIEQEKIANFLEIKANQFDSLITKKEQLIQKLEEAKKSLISEVVTGKVKIIDGEMLERQPGEMKDSGTNFGEIPHQWKRTKMKFEVTINARIGWKGLKADEYVEAGYIFLSTPNIKGREIDFENVNYIEKRRYDESPNIKLKKGDVLLAKDGSTLGTVNVIRTLVSQGTVNSSIAILRKIGTIVPRYLYYLLKSDSMVWTINMMKDGMGVPHLFQGDIKEFYLIIPSTLEMDLICDYLDMKTLELDELTIKITLQIQKLKQAKQSLISEAVTGKIDLRDWQIIEEGE